MGQEELKELLSIIKNSGAIERSLAVSDRYLEKALAILKELPDNRAKKALRDIAKFIGKRKF